LALADDNHSKTRAYALDALHSLIFAAKKLDVIDADTINNVTRGIFMKVYQTSHILFLTSNVIINTFSCFSPFER